MTRHLFCTLMPHMAESHARRLADTLLPEGLETYVTVRLNAGASWRRISLDLLRDIELDLHPATLRMWFPELEKSESAAS